VIYVTSEGVIGVKRRFATWEPWRRRANMHTFVFRSYDLIIASSEVELVRDVRQDPHKAATKLRNIREQLRRDREHAAARAVLLTKAEARLSAAIAVAQRSPPIAPASSDLGSAYEELLRRYVDESVKWHAAANSSAEYDDADEAMCQISARMEPLEEQIEQIDISPDDPERNAKLRIVALKDLRFKLPSFHEEWEISDGNSGDLEMFWQVLEFVGIADFARSVEQRVKAAIKTREAAAVV
jgi:hypothetical protein